MQAKITNFLKQVKREVAILGASISILICYISCVTSGPNYCIVPILKLIALIVFIFQMLSYIYISRAYNIIIKDFILKSLTRLCTKRFYFKIIIRLRLYFREEVGIIAKIILCL